MPMLAMKGSFLALFAEQSCCVRLETGLCASGVDLHYGELQAAGIVESEVDHWRYASSSTAIRKICCGVGLHESPFQSPARIACLVGEPSSCLSRHRSVCLSIMLVNTWLTMHSSAAVGLACKSAVKKGPGEDPANVAVIGAHGLCLSCCAAPLITKSASARVLRRRTWRRQVRALWCRRACSAVRRLWASPRSR